MKKLISLALVLTVILSLGVLAFAENVEYYEHGQHKRTETGTTNYTVKEPYDKAHFIDYQTGKGTAYKPGDVVDASSGMNLYANYCTIMFRPWEKGSEEGIYFLFTASDDLKVYVDKEETTEFTFENYKLTLNPEFLETLKTGNRVLEVYSKNGNFWDCFVIVDPNESK